MFNKFRIRLEGRVLRHIVRHFAADGWEVTVNDGENDTLVKSTSVDRIFKALRTADEDYLLVYKDDGARRGWIQLVYGNAPWEVVCDYSTSIEDHMDVLNTYCNKIEDDYN